MDVKKEERCHSVEWDVSSFLVDGQLCLRYVTLAAVGLPQHCISCHQTGLLLLRGCVLSRTRVRTNHLARGGDGARPDLHSALLAAACFYKKRVTMPKQILS